MGVVGGVERMYHVRQFPPLGAQNNLSCVVFRKENDHESPRSSRLESHRLS